LFPDFRELFWSVGPVISCGDIHQSFSNTLVKWFFDNFPMFANSFSVLSIHRVARGLGASFLYKCPASRGGSPGQHGFVVMVALCNRADHYIFMLFLLLSSFIFYFLA